jgi:hypothetical protein
VAPLWAACRVRRGDRVDDTSVESTGPRLHTLRREASCTARQALPRRGQAQEQETERPTSATPQSWASRTRDFQSSRRRSPRGTAAPDQAAPRGSSSSLRSPAPRLGLVSSATSQTEESSFTYGRRTPPSLSQRNCMNVSSTPSAGRRGPTCRPHGRTANRVPTSAVTRPTGDLRGAHDGEVAVSDDFRHVADGPTADAERWEPSGSAASPRPIPIGAEAAGARLSSAAGPPKVRRPTEFLRRAGRQEQESSRGRRYARQDPEAAGLITGAVGADRVSRTGWWCGQAARRYQWP